jgi:anthranilate phosphoribosyltransferase
VLLNAAAVLVAAGMAVTIAEGVMLAAKAVDDGAVERLVEMLAGSGGS